METSIAQHLRMHKLIRHKKHLKRMKRRMCAVLNLTGKMHSFTQQNWLVNTIFGGYISHRGKTQINWIPADFSHNMQLSDVERDLNMFQVFPIRDALPNRKNLRMHLRQ